MIIFNGWKPLTVITKSSILDVAVVLDPLQLNSFGCYRGHFLPSFSSALRNCPNNFAILSYDVNSLIIPNTQPTKNTQRIKKAQPSNNIHSTYKKLSTYEKLSKQEKHSAYEKH